jgi:hypothetical protein
MLQDTTRSKLHDGHGSESAYPILRSSVPFSLSFATASISGTGSRPARIALGYLALSRRSSSPVPQPTSSTRALGLIGRRRKVSRVVASR